MAENLPMGPEHVDAAEVTRRFEEKQRLLGAAGQKTESREVFREAFRETAGEKVTSTVPTTSAPASVTPVSNSSAAKGDPHVQTLVDIALEKGIVAAVRKAEAETPYLIDALHDELADHYYEKLIAAGRLAAE